MSEINKYSMYSQFVSQETKNEIGEQKVALIIKDFENIESVENAKKYINEKLGIKDNVLNYPMSGKSYLSILEENNVYVVRFETEKDNYSFSYKKDTVKKYK